MPDFKVGDRVRVRADVKEPKYCWLATVPRNEIGVVRWFYQDCVYVVLPSLPPGTCPWGIHADELEPAEPDPRDAEIAALKARVAELESRQADEDRLYYRQLVAAALINRDVPTAINYANAAFAEVKRREAKGGGA